MAKKIKPGISGTARPIKPRIMHKLPIMPREIRTIIKVARLLIYGQVSTNRTKR
jgi:hypothetical protein